ncbi:MAG TPA: biotin--[acetyl-CoA-carboxylase] ligase [Streptosporangiaceae bacterium]|nr:biotin--[acetyl-CoA-carboxylase] ligase [Streptosporangiaceae bacterium]
MTVAGAAGPGAPLDGERLAAALRGSGAAAMSMWADVRIVAATASTNTDVLREAAAGAAEGLVIAAESQTAGKGRLGRTWQTRPGSALTFSVLLRPADVPPAARGWLPLLAGVAVVGALAEVCGLNARLKWPNDVLAGGGKLAGILAEQSGDAIVVGIGINVLGGANELPIATATSLERCGLGGTDRTALLAAILHQLEHWYLRWRQTGPGDADASGLRKQYLSMSATAGKQVSVQLPGDHVLTGVAAGVDGAGQLLVEAEPGAGLIAVSAGDVIHVRAAAAGATWRS